MQLLLADSPPNISVTKLYTPVVSAYSNVASVGPYVYSFDSAVAPSEVFSGGRISQVMAGMAFTWSQASSLGGRLKSPTRIMSFSMLIPSWIGHANRQPRLDRDVRIPSLDHRAYRRAALARPPGRHWRASR